MADLHSFRTVPTRKPPRSRFNLGKNAVFTISEGALFPFYCEEALPFDTWEIDLGFSCRNLQTQVHPVMDDVYIDFFWFYVPSRLLFKQFPQMMGVDQPSAFTNPTEITLPVIGDFAVTCAKGSVANGLGLPSGFMPDASDGNDDVNALPFAGHSLIWNEWFRDENLQDSDPVHELVFNAASGADLSLNASFVSAITPYFSHAAGRVAVTSVNKYKDLFTSALPAPQKGPEVAMLTGYANVIGDATQQTAATMHNVGSVIWGTGNDATPYLVNGMLGTSSGRMRLGDTSSASGDNITRSNLVADLSTVTDNTIDTLRKSIAMQVYFEQLARGGSRYNELLRAQFGVAPLDAVLQRPELIGYQHVRLNQQQVATTAGQGTVGTPAATATGTLGGYSVTSDYKKQTFKSFEEYGFIYGYAAIRVKHKYWQGIPKKFKKHGRFDFFIPAFDRIGEVPISKKEIFDLGSGTFGFAPAWYEYRHTPDTVAGEIVPDGTALDLGAWTYADTFGSAPTLSSAFIKEGRSNVDQTLAGSSSIAQYLVSVDCDIKATRPMSLASNPSRLGM